MTESQDDKEKSRLRDIPSMKELTENAQNMKLLKDTMPLFGPILEGLGVDVNKMSESLQPVDDLSKKIDELTSVPDRFNDIFAEHGWILYDMMNFEVAKNAVEKAEKGDLQGAEQDIMDYYNADTVRWSWDV